MFWSRGEPTPEPLGERSNELSSIVMARAQTKAEPFGCRSDEPFCLSSRGAKRRGDPSRVLRGLPQSPRLLRNDKQSEFIRRSAATWPSIWNFRGLPQSAGLLRNDNQVFIGRSAATKQSSWNSSWIAAVGEPSAQSQAGERRIFTQSVPLAATRKFFG